MSDSPQLNAATIVREALGRARLTPHHTAEEGIHALLATLVDHINAALRETQPRPDAGSRFVIEDV